MDLAEKYRPRTWAAVVGQPQAVARMELLASTGFGGKAVWLSGRSGSGKTTLALIAAATHADEWHTETTTGRALSLSLLREWRDASRFADRRAFIVNEAHGLCAPVIEELLNVLEPIPARVAWFFTTTREGQAALFDEKIDAHPLLSRCKLVPLTSKAGAEQTATYLRGIAQAEGLDGKPIRAYVKLVNENRGNIRACFQEIESGGMRPGNGSDDGE